MIYVLGFILVILLSMISMSLCEYLYKNGKNLEKNGKKFIELIENDTGYFF